MPRGRAALRISTHTKSYINWALVELYNLNTFSLVLEGAGSHQTPGLGAAALACHLLNRSCFVFAGVIPFRGMCFVPSTLKARRG